nr:hypothetical protein GCM10010200_048460 [Actinomadura rugatobispora]
MTRRLNRATARILPRPRTDEIRTATAATATGNLSATPTPQRLDTVKQTPSSACWEGRPGSLARHGWSRTGPSTSHTETSDATVADPEDDHDPAGR